MEAPLTPLAFARRARKLYPDREAVVDGALRLTYEGFLSRCDRWSGALQRLGVGRGDRVVYISPNTHMHLESFYAVPQTGAVLVPINFRLTANDFEYIINHCGAVAVCVHADQLDAVNTIRTKLPHVHHFVSLEGTRDVGVPHATWGEVPHAFVVLRSGVAVTEDELRAFVRSRLAHFKAPRDFTFVPELPKTATGKIQKYVLRQGRSAVIPS